MKFICIGRNYAKHIQELNNATPESPVLFLKPDTALLQNNQDFFIPEYSNDVHFECEVLFRVSRQGKYVQSKFATTYLDAVGLGIDFTARDLQSELKSKGLPWEISKAFNNSAAVSNFFPIQNYPNLHQISFKLFVNGELRQNGNTSDQIYKIEALVEYSSQYFMIKAGDIFFTGTPEGVGKVNPGDHLEGYLEDKKVLDFYIR